MARQFHNLDGWTRDLRAAIRAGDRDRCEAVLDALDDAAELLDAIDTNVDGVGDDAGDEPASDDDPAGPADSRQQLLLDVDSGSTGQLSRVDPAVRGEPGSEGSPSVHRATVVARTGHGVARRSVTIR